MGEGFGSLVTKRGPGGIPYALYALVIGAAAVFLVRRRSSGTSSTGTSSTPSDSGGVIPVVLGTITVIEKGPAGHTPTAPKKPAPKKPAPKKKKAPHTQHPKPKPKKHPKPPTGHYPHPQPPARMPKRPGIPAFRRSTGSGSTGPILVNGFIPSTSRTATTTHTGTAGQAGTAQSLALPVNL